MDSLKKLADLNLAISEANSKLKDIKDSETEYIKLREGKVEKQIEELLTRSAELLDNTHKNYEGIHTFCNILSTYKEFLDENYASLSEGISLFEERNKEWDKRYEEQVAELGRQERVIKDDKAEVEINKREVEKAKEEIKKDRNLLEDRKQTLSRALERLKLNKK